MTTQFAFSFGDYGAWAVVFVAIFLVALHQSRRKTRKQEGSQLDKQVKDLEHVSGILERMVENKQRDNDPD